MGKARTRRSSVPEEPVVPKTRKPVTLRARNPHQREYIEAIHKNDITFGIGSAGTGKTYIPSKLAIKYFTERDVEKIVICRPAVTAGGEDIGFLPGGINEKMHPYVSPILDAFREYWSEQTINQHLADKTIEIIPLAFMRGRDLKNAFIIADEMQNATEENLLMLVTRLGEGSKMVISGDPVQTDVGNESCFNVAARRLRGIDTIQFVYFSEDDVVRHSTVAKILKVWPNNGITGEGGDCEHMPRFLVEDAA